MAISKIALIEGSEDTLKILSPLLATVYGTGLAIEAISQNSALTILKNPSDEVFAAALIASSIDNSKNKELIEELRKHNHSIPLIFVLPKYDNKEVQKILAAGADDYLVLEKIDERLIEKCIRYATERAKTRAAELGLKESEIRFKTLIEGLGEGIIFADPDDKIIHINSRLGRMTGYDPTEIIGRVAYEVLLPPNEQRLLRERTERRLQGISESYEIPLMRSDGSRFWAEIHATPVFDAAGKIVGTLGAVTDINERKAAKDALEASEKKYRDLVELSGNLIWSLDIEGRFQFVNQASRKIYGYEPHEMIGQSLTHYSSKKYLGSDKHLLSNVFEGLTYFHYETEHVSRDGTPLTLSLNATPKKGEDGKIIGITGTTTDISARKRTERALRKSEQRFKSYFHLPLVGFAITSPNKEWVDVNEKLCKMLGYSREELIERSWIDLTHPEDVEKDLELFIKVQSGEIDSYSLDKRYIKKTGDVLYATISVGCVRKVQGEVDYYVALIQEITDRVTMQEELRHQQQYLRQVIDTSSNLIFARDETGRLTLVNESTAQLFNTTVESMLGKTASQVCLEFNFENQTEDSDFFGDDKEVFQTRRSSIIREHVIFEKRHKSPRIYQMAKTLLARDDGKPPQVLSVATDITQRKTAEEETYELQKQLMQSQKMEAIGQLAAGVAHDLNNALGAVVGHLQLMKLNSLDNSNTLNHSIEVALSGCERASSLIEQLLGFSRQGRYNLKRLCLQTVVDETISFLSRILEKNIRIEKVNTGFKLFIDGDQGQLQQVLTNLIINAKQAMPEGGLITFEFGLATVPSARAYNPRATAGEFVTLKVKDTGIGMPSEVLDKIFEPFYTTKGERGTGLGLSMVYGAIQSHGGWIDVRSTPGKGSSFTLFLPRASETMIIEKEVVSTEEGGSRSGTVMVIDDEPHLVDLAKTFLSQRGYKAKGFTSGKEAVEWYSSNARTVDLVILDMKMPDMDGKACFQRIKQINDEAKVVILTGYVQDEAAQDLMNSGVLKFFQKPLKYPDLMNWISSNIGGT